LSPSERLQGLVAILLAALTSYNENCPQKLQWLGGKFEDGVLGELIVWKELFPLCYSL